MRTVPYTNVKEDLLKEKHDLEIEINKIKVDFEILATKREEMENSCVSRQEHSNQLLLDIKNKVVQAEKDLSKVNALIKEKETVRSQILKQLEKERKQIDEEAEKSILFIEMSVKSKEMQEKEKEELERVKNELQEFNLEAENRKSELSKELRELLLLVESLKVQADEHKKTLEEKIDAPVNYANHLLKKEKDLMTVERRMRTFWKEKFKDMSFPEGTWSFNKP